MGGEELVERCRRLASEQAALHGPVCLASPLEDGEDLDSAEIEDADHWVAVYSELVEFKQELLREIDRQALEIRRTDPEFVPSNRRAFVLELQRLQLHLQYWSGRRQELRKRPAHL